MRKRNTRNFAKKKHHTPAKRSSKLDVRRTDYFRFDCQDLFKKYEVEEKIANPLLSFLVAKATRTGLKEAKDYVLLKEEEGAISKEVAESLTRLLDRYKKWR